LGQEGANGFIGIELAVAGLAIEAVKFEVLLELGEADETLQCGLAHLGDVLELHVVGDEGFDLVGFVIGKTEAAAKVIGHADADVDVAVEADSVAGFGGGAECGGLANVVKQNAPGKCGRGSGGESFEHEEGVNPNVSFGVELRRLRNAFHGRDFRKQLGGKAEFVEEFEPPAGGAFGEELGELFADAFRGNDVDFARVRADSGEGFRFDNVAEARGEADGAEHAELVFGETPGRLADGADDSCGEIGTAADEVEDFAGVVAHEEAVDGEIAALDVFFGCFGIDDLIGMPAVGVAEVGAEGGDFDLQGILADEDDTELRADIEAVWEEFENFFWSGAGGDVEIGRVAMKEDVAHAAADEEGPVAVELKRVADRIGEFPGVHGMIMRQKERSDEAKK